MILAYRLTLSPDFRTTGFDIIYQHPRILLSSGAPHNVSWRVFQHTVNLGNIPAIAFSHHTDAVDIYLAGRFTVALPTTRIIYPALTPEQIAQVQNILWAWRPLARLYIDSGVVQDCLG